MDRYRYRQILRIFGIGSISADTLNFWYRIDTGIDRYSEFLVLDRYRYRQILRIFYIGSISADTLNFGIRSISVLADTPNFWNWIDIGRYSDFWYQIDIGRYTEFLVSDRYRYRRILRFLVSDRYRQIHWIFGIGSISVLADTQNFWYWIDIGIGRYSKFLLSDRYRYRQILRIFGIGFISVLADTPNFWYRIDIGRYTEFLVSDRYRYWQILQIFGIGSISADTPIFGIRSISADTLNFWYRIDIGIDRYLEFLILDRYRYRRILRFLVSDRYRQIHWIFGIGSISVSTDT